LQVPIYTAAVSLPVSFFGRSMYWDVIRKPCSYPYNTVSTNKCSGYSTHQAKEIDAMLEFIPGREWDYA